MSASRTISVVTSHDPQQCAICAQLIAQSLSAEGRVSIPTKFDGEIWHGAILRSIQPAALMCDVCGSTDNPKEYAAGTFCQECADDINQSQS